jgi:hypothetical protein
MNKYFLTTEQHSFLIWVNRNYEWLKMKGYTTKWQPTQHNIHRIMVSSGYTDEDRVYLKELLRFINGLGLVTYKRDWIWDKNGAELDWTVNVKIN